MSLSASPLEKKYVTVNGKQLAYHEAGSGETIVFLHGNPTSSYLWRNIIPFLSATHRCIAPDLIGHGDSDKLDSTEPGSYRFVEHREYLDGVLDQLELGDNITLVIHDWGSALGFDWANRHRDRVSGIVYMEAIVQSMTWEQWPESIRGIFQGFRSEAADSMIIDKNIFVERILPGSVLRGLTEEEMDIYRKPFADPKHRRPTLTWPQQIPLGGDPADVVEIVDAYGDWLAGADVRKLFINAEPGAILTGDQREFCRTWPNQVEVTVAGSHFIQEDSPTEIGTAIADWLSNAPA